MRIRLKDIAIIVDICKDVSTYPTRDLERFSETFLAVPSRSEIEEGKIRPVEMKLIFDFTSGWVLEIEDELKECKNETKN